MKKFTFIGVLAVSIFLCLLLANAAILGVELLLPDILSDQTGIYTYTWDSNEQEGMFTARATPLTITFDGVTSIPIGGVNRN